MAIAITPFEAFCGFLPASDIAKYLDEVPELVPLISESITSSFRSAATRVPAERVDLDAIKNALRELFGALMNASASEVKATIASIRSRYVSGQASEEEKKIKDLLLRLDDQFPGDVGVLCTFVLNFVTLEPGQAVFLKANEPHAYISGGMISFDNRVWRVLRKAFLRHSGDYGYIG